MKRTEITTKVYAIDGQREGIKRDVPYLDLTQPTVTLSREALARAVRALDEREGLALVRAAYGLGMRQARLAWWCILARLF